MNANKSRLLLAMTLSLGVAACGGEHSEGATDDEVSVATESETLEYTSAELPQTEHEGEMDTLDTLLRGIREQVGSPQASRSNQCRVIGIGHRPCGGPERYLLYSTQTTDESQLLPMVERYNALVRQRVEDEGMVGTCEVLPEPGVTLRNGVCSAMERAEM